MPVVSSPTAYTLSALPEINVTELPSGFKCYPSGCTISILPYTFGEIKKFNQSKLSLTGVFEFVLSGVTTSFDKNDLTLSDVLYLGLLRKISTLKSSKVSVKHECPKCSTINTKVLDIQSIEFVDLPATSLPVSIVFNKVKYEFKPLSIGRYFDLIKKGLERDELALMTAQCCNVGYDEAYKVFFELPPSEGEFLEEIDRYLYHGVKPIEIVCTSCQTSNLVDVEGGDVIIAPFRDSVQPSESRIQFGN